MTPAQLDEEVRQVFQRRTWDRDARERQEEMYLQRRLERLRQDLLRGDIWPKCNTAACVRRILAKDITGGCVQCGSWWNW